MKFVNIYSFFNLKPDKITIDSYWISLHVYRDIILSLK